MEGGLEPIGAMLALVSPPPPPPPPQILIVEVGLRKQSWFMKALAGERARSKYWEVRRGFYQAVACICVHSISTVITAWEGGIQVCSALSRRRGVHPFSIYSQGWLRYRELRHRSLILAEHCILAAGWEFQEAARWVRHLQSPILKLVVEV